MIWIMIKCFFLFDAGMEQPVIHAGLYEEKSAEPVWQRLKTTLAAEFMGFAIRRAALAIWICRDVSRDGVQS